jgi:hypothetical protein
VIAGRGLIAEDHTDGIFIVASGKQHMRVNGRMGGGGLSWSTPHCSASTFPSP